MIFSPAVKMLSGRISKPYIIPICGQGKPHWEIKIEKCSFKYWLLDNHKFGENMFFTREEAEKALKEREENA